MKRGSEFLLPWLVLAAVGLCGCTEEGVPEPVLQRIGSFGSLRDLSLFVRSESDGGSFFLDRFEATNADWHDYLTATGQEPSEFVVSLWGDLRPAGRDAQRPVAGVNLGEARAFARWRHCRLLRWDEWFYAATNRDQKVFPWGNLRRPNCANTSDLGLFAPTLVGTFESGRARGGPYDLIGNVAEWTETVPPRWYGNVSTSGVVSGTNFYLTEAQLARADPAVSPWLVPGVPTPSSLVLARSSQRFPRLVVGGDYLTPMVPPGPPSATVQGDLARWNWDAQSLPEDRAERVGVRLAATPDELMRALLRHEAELAENDEAILRQFVRRRGHRDVLLPAWRHSRGEAGGPVADLLEELLGS